jgi:hypothetical protein
MTSSYESYSRAGADEPDVGIPNILKRILRISFPARAVNRGPALFGANHGQFGSISPEWILAQERLTSGRKPFVYEHFSTPAMPQNYRGDLYRATEIEWLTRMVESNAG